MCLLHGGMRSDGEDEEGEEGGFLHLDAFDEQQRQGATRKQ